MAVTSISSGVCRLGRVVTPGLTSLAVRLSRLSVSCLLLLIAVGLVVWKILRTHLIVSRECLVLTCVMRVRCKVVLAAVISVSVVTLVIDMVV